MAAFPDYDSGLTKNGKWRYKLAGAYLPGMVNIDPNVIKIPCGKCVGCQLDYSRSWADRMMLELNSYDGNAIFVTLTYDNDHIIYVQDGNLEDCPVGFTLSKRDIQLFFKRLRGHFSDRKIRFYACGEYGSRTHRPHSHCIIFGLSLEDFPDLRVVGKNELGQFYFSSPSFEKIWSNGFVCLSSVSYKTCAYVSRYVIKKAFSSEEPYLAEPEFRLMSRNPGLGHDYLVSHPDCLELSKISLSDSNGHVDVRIPKYFFNKIKLTDPERYDIIIKDRIKSCRDSELLKLQQTSLGYIDLLELEENSKLNKTKILYDLRERSFENA